MCRRKQRFETGRRSIRWLVLAAASVLALITAYAYGQRVELQLDQVQFPSEREMHVKGSVTAHGLMWPEEIQNDRTVSCRLWVAVDFMRRDGTWNVLPDEFRGKSTDREARVDRQVYGPDSVGIYTDNRKHPQGTPWLNIPLNPLVIFERELEEPVAGNPNDEGKSFAFDTTLDFPAAIRIPDEYRIVARLERSTSFYGMPARFWNFFTYATRGPNPWGTGNPPATPITGVSALGVNGPTASANPDVWNRLHGSTGTARTDTGTTDTTGGNTGAAPATGDTTTPGNQGQQPTADPQAAQTAIEQALGADASLSNVQVAVTAERVVISTAPPANTDSGQWPNKIAEIAGIAAQKAPFTKELHISFVNGGQHLEAKMSQADASRFAAGTINLQKFIWTWDVTSSTTAAPEHTPTTGATETRPHQPPAQNAGTGTSGAQQTPGGGGQTAQDTAGTVPQPPAIADVTVTPAPGQPTDTARAASDRASMAQQALQTDCTTVLGLRNVRVVVGDSRVEIAASAPDLPSRALWTPMIAYALADASLVAPWTDTVAVTFSSLDGTGVSVDAARTDADAYVNGATTLKQFMGTWNLASPSAPQAGDQPGGQPTTGGPQTPVPSTPSTPASGATAAGKAATEVLLEPGHLPQGWQTLEPVEFSAAEILATVAPGSGISSVPVDSAAMQTLQIGDEAYTIIAMVSPSNAEAQTTLGKLSGGQTGPGLITVAQNPPVHGMIIGQTTYLVYGSGPDVARVGSVIGMAYADAASGTTPSTPQTPTQPATQTPTQPQTPPPGQAQEMALDPTSVVKEAIICEGVDEHNDPVGVGETFSSQTDKIALVLRLEGAAPNTEITLEWTHDGDILARRILIVGGDQRLVTHIFPSKAQYLPSGNYAVEISEGDRLVGRRVFTIQ